MSVYEKGIVAVTGRAHCQRQVAFFNIYHTKPYEMGWMKKIDHPTIIRWSDIDTTRSDIILFGDHPAVILQLFSDHPAAIFF